MKNILVLLAVTVICYKTTQAQEREYVPFPMSGAKWTTAGYEGSVSNIYFGPRFVYTIENNDTIIDGKTYHILYCNNQYCCAIREENKQVFVNFPEYTEEHLMYDFNLQINDTIFYNLGTYGNLYAYGFGFAFDERPVVHYKVVESIDSIQINSGEIRKRWKLKTKISFRENEWITGGDNYWIEGIGDPGWIGLFNPFVCDRFVNQHGFNMICFSHNNMILYQSARVGSICNDCNCRMPANSILETEKNNMILFPNPVTGECTITSANQNITGIYLFDCMGKKISTFTNLTVPQVTIDLSFLPPGVYVAQIATEQGTIIKKIIKQ